ncbi:hypothetical protein L6452_27733 [Arctium lappa]|uniref:Uncharacterized protein n=1 Tax=Arctium lappa TaxID=4217 RepID=A0ACB8ZWJ4_ARCLA|nr:hypothetical protein L6452_27733 [Arctium lappa]
MAAKSVAREMNFAFIGFHEFAEFTVKDVLTSESGLNSVVLACNSEMVLLPMNEPVYETKRKIQIQTYLEHNEVAGVQHLALTSEDIFRTLREMRKRSGVGGFEFMPSSAPACYGNLKKRADNVLSGEPFKECEEIGDIGFKFMSSPPCLIIQAPNGRVMWVWNGSRGFLEGGFLQKA